MVLRITLEHLAREHTGAHRVGAVADALLDLGNLLGADVRRGLDSLAGSGDRARVGRQCDRVDARRLLLLRLTGLLRGGRDGAGASELGVLDVRAGGVLALESIDVVLAEMWTSSVVEWLFGRRGLVVKYVRTAAF